ncbi:KIAA1410 protein, putative, partial [Trichomonas vaginalis G3]
MTVEAVDQVNEMQKCMEEMQAEQDTYNRHEKLFSFEQGSNKVLVKLQSEFTPLHTLWNLANDWQTTRALWLDTSFTQIKPEPMNQFIIQATKKLNKLKKELADQHFLVDRVLNPLSQQIDEFKKHVPLIMKLRHPGIKTKHWEEISKVVGFNAAPDLELTLQGFLDLHFEQWMEQVTQIANVAAQEYTLETSLDQMDADLQTKKFVTSEFRNSGQFILNEIDDITSTIDDQLVTTQTILASPFIEPVKKRAQERLSFLHLSEKIIMKWISCQKNWLYLQPIFTGTSIQQKLAKEARLNGTHNHPEFQTVMTRDGLFDQLNQCNNLLDQINIGLNKYLEAKRMGFPRFFFLSNDELITILSHSKEIGKVQESLSKLFEYVNTVTMDGDDIVSMNDSEGEKVKLFNPVQFDTPEIEDWLNNFEAEMKHSLNQYIEQANMAIKKQSKEEWITSFPAQVILITNQINWRLQVTQVLSGQKLQAMKVLLQKYLEQLETLTGLVRKPIDRLTRQVLSCLLILEVHNREIIKDFVHKEV